MGRGDRSSDQPVEKLAPADSSLGLGVTIPRSILLRADQVIE